LHGELMSRIGNKPIAIPKGVKIEQKGQTLKVTGPQGSLEWACHPTIEVAVDEAAAQIVVSNSDAENSYRKAMHGTTRALLQNMVTGVSKGFERPMAIYGTGYNVKEQGGKLVLAVGYCHPVELPIPKEVKVEIKVAATRGNDVPASFILRSPDRQILGQFAANVRRVRPPEPYKGKGIRYGDEVVRRKVGKAFTSGG
jgi:large subunit ribosomal protein L6